MIFVRAMTDQIPENDDIKLQLEALFSDLDNLVLATVNSQGEAEASYAPFVEHENRYYLFVSALASHTSNLERTRAAGILFVDRQGTGNAFTRKRLSCQCQATPIKRSDPLFELVMKKMQQRFGALTNTLRGLADFQLFQLQPEKGNFVAGFGRAFEIDFPLGDEIRHKRPG